MCAVRRSRRECSRGVDKTESVSLIIRYKSRLKYGCCLIPNLHTLSRSRKERPSRWRNPVIKHGCCSIQRVCGPRDILHRKGGLRSSVAIFLRNFRLELRRLSAVDHPTESLVHDQNIALTSNIHRDSCSTTNTPQPRDQNSFNRKPNYLL
jgi:hypothetical protein